jgi:hypothetical protein
VRAAPEGRELDLDVWVENQKGELVLRGLATCRVTGPSFAEPRLDELMGALRPPVPPLRPAQIPARPPVPVKPPRK